MFPLGVRASHWFWLVAFLLFILVFELGTRGLNEPDEGRYANIAREALEMDHPWWEPQMSDVGHYDKPPLTYWISALGYETLGLNEWGARLPSLLGALMSLCAVGWLAFRRYGPRLAWLAVLMTGTLLQFWAWGRLLSCDMLLTGWCALAIAAWQETRYRGGGVVWWSLQVLFWSLAGWTKATPALIPLLGLALFVYAAGDTEDRRALRLPLLLPLVLLLSIPWYAIILLKHPGLQNFFVHREIDERITGHIAGRAGPIYYYIPLCLAGWLPWWPLALVAAIRQRAQLSFGGGRWKEILGPGAFLVITGFCVFSIIGSKHATYLLPFTPWVALEMARLIHRDRAMENTPLVPAVGAVAAAVYLVALTLVPARQSHFGMHSSLRDVAALLRRDHAARIYSDHYWPSLEFYWGENVFFSDGPPTEIADPADQASEHFGVSDPPPGRNGWFVHFRKDNNPTFKAWLDDPRIPKTSVGDFVIGPMMAETAAQRPAARTVAAASRQMR